MRKIVLIIVISLLALTACNANTTPEPEINIEAELPQNYRAELLNGSVSLNYPENWAINGEFPEVGVTLATTDNLVNDANFDGVVSAGQVYVQISFAPESMLGEMTIEELLDTIVTSLGQAQGTIGEPQTTTFNGKEATFVTLDGDNAGSDGLFIVIDSGDAFSTLVVAVADGELAQYEDTAKAIAASIDYTLNTSE